MKIHSSLALLGVLSSATACLLPEEIEAEREYHMTGTRPSRSRRFPSFSKRALNSFPVGTGDRFEHGTVPPVGIGLGGSFKDSILGVDEVASGLAALEAAYPDKVKVFQPPFLTHEGRRMEAAVVGIGGPENDDIMEPRAFIMSGIHARERGGPDHVLYFVSDLLAAHERGSGLTYGAKEFSAEDVADALTAGIVVLPVANPDGVAYDQQTGTCWRKNRRPSAPYSGGGHDQQAVGVDLNRNFDFLWDYKAAFNRDVPEYGTVSSDDVTSEMYHGPEAESEAETQAVRWIMDSFNETLSWFVDLHSYGGKVLYAWGDDDTGTQDPEQNMVSPWYDGQRGFTGTDPVDSRYKEYLSVGDLEISEETATAMARAMTEVGGAKDGPGRMRSESIWASPLKGQSHREVRDDVLGTHRAQPAVQRYPTSGASSDYAMSRYYGGRMCGAGMVYGLTVEFGRESAADQSCPFYADGDEYHDSMAQVAAGLLEMMGVVVGPDGDPRYSDC